MGVGGGETGGLVGDMTAFAVTCGVGWWPRHGCCVWMPLWFGARVLDRAG